MKEHYLPPEEEIKMNDYFDDDRYQRDLRPKLEAYYMRGFMRGKYYTAQRILDYIKENKLPKKDYQPLIEFILGRKLKTENNDKQDTYDFLLDMSRIPKIK